jgi:hypothetical protein
LLDPVALSVTSIESRRSVLLVERREWSRSLSTSGPSLSPPQLLLALEGGR